MAFLGLVRAVDPIAVGHAGTGFGKVAVPDVIGTFAQRDALQFATSVVVEYAQLDPFGML